jgi:hypothetical protein
MTSAIVLNAVGALIIVGGWTLAVLYAYRALAADGRRPASPQRLVPDRNAQNGAAGSGRATVPATNRPKGGVTAPGDQDVEREYSLARSAR